MTTTIARPAASTSPDRDSLQSQPRPSRWRRFARSASIVGIVLLVVAIVAALINMGAERSERKTLPTYGERVAVEGGHLNVYRHGETGPTIVMLTGYGTPAPALDFAPLIRELEGFQIVVVEGSGTGTATRRPRRGPSRTSAAKSMKQSLPSTSRSRTFCSAIRSPGSTTSTMPTGTPRRCPR